MAVYRKSDWSPGEPFPDDVAQQVASAIVGGSPFANSLAQDTARSGGGKVYPRINSVAGAAWVAEGADLPDLALDVDSYIASTCKIGGIVLISRETIEDAGNWSPQSETARIIQDSFSADLDDGLLNGDGTPPHPQGVIEVATAATGTTLVAAVADAMADIGEAGGTPTHVAVSPTLFATTAAEEGTDGHAKYPNGLSAVLGLAPVRVPGLATPLVYDAAQVRLLTSRNFTVTPSLDYSPAYKADAIALRISGRFAVAVPLPAKSIRKLTIG